MNQDNTPTTNQEHKVVKRSKLPLEAGIVLVILILLAVVGIIGRQYKSSTDNKKAAAVPAAYADEALTPLALKGLSFQLPEELSQYSKSDTQAEFFNHYVSIKDHYDRQLYSSVAYAQFSTKPSDNDLIGINANLQNPKYKDYAKTIAPINKFVSDRLPTASKTTLTNGKQFRNENIKANAWSFDLAATDSKVKGNPVKGQVIYIVNGQDQYYFVLYSSSRD